MRWRSRAKRGRREPWSVSDVPQNAGYMAAAYVVAAVILLGYAVSLYKRSGRP